MSRLAFSYHHPFPGPSWGTEDNIETLVSGPVSDIPWMSSPHGVDSVIALFLGSW